MSRSISFSRAAEFYDRTRALKPEVRQRVTAGLLAELERLGTRRLLEVGAGTGRIARPLVDRGVRVTGVDIAVEMLRRFQEQVPEGAERPDLLLGDATQLPFADDVFPAALVVHVLHLILPWREAIGEIRRVLSPGGAVLHQTSEDDFESLPEHRESSAAWDAALAKRGFAARKRAERDDINACVRELGGSARTVELCEYFHTRAESEFIAALRQRLHSQMWEIPDDVYWPAVDEYEAWARARFDNLNTERRVTAKYLLDVWTFD